MVKGFARWFAERTGGPVPRFEKVEARDERILEDPEQRERDGLPSALDPAARSERPGRNARSVRPGLGQHTLELHDGAVAHDLRMR
jgi:hypothetical protein